MKPSKIHLHKRSKTLELHFAECAYTLSAELLRVHSPSAEVKGHGPNQAVLVDGKIHVGITDMTPTGHYGVQLVFDDGHDSGIYSWPYLYELCLHQQRYWQDYLAALKQAQKSRDPAVSVIQFSP